MNNFYSNNFDQILMQWLLQKVSADERAQLLSRLLCDPNFREQMSAFVKTLRSPWAFEVDLNSKRSLKKRAA